jgi:predicted secreted protein
MVALVALIAALHLTAAANNHSYTVKPQTPIVVTLSSNRSTAYQWKLASQPAHGVVRLVSHQYVKPKVVRPGAAGKEIWGFKAVGKGVTKLALVYVRSFQPTPARRVTITIRVS